MNLKKDRILFVSEVKKIIEENGLVKIQTYQFEKGKIDYLDYCRYQLKTDKNTLEMILKSHMDHTLVYSVTGVLETPSPRTGNPYSGKVNFHSSAPVLSALADFEDHIKELVKNEL